MFDRLPPLTALRAFEAAARHMSFARAADELHVTPAALSFQIKALETQLGAPVFLRLNRAVELTEEGRALAVGCRDGFAAINAAWANARRLLDDQHLNVTAGPAFTAKWLAPRLYEFAQAHPDVELRFSASLKIMDFDRDGIDVAIRFGYGTSDPALFSLPLANEWVTPVMTPELAERFPTPESLKDAPFIFDQSIDFLDPPADWHAWFDTMGLADAPTHGLSFSQSDHALDAALAGVGVTLGRRAFVVKDILEGRLAAPYNVAVDTGARFTFLCPAGHENRPQISAFREWMLTEIDKTRSVTDAMDVRPLKAPA